MPGNIRELENVIERTLLFSDRSVLDASDFHLGPVSVSRRRGHQS